MLGAPGLIQTCFLLDEMDEKKEVGSKMVESKEELNAGKMEFRNAIEAMSMEVSSKMVDKLVAAEEEEGEVV